MSNSDLSWYLLHGEQEESGNDKGVVTQKIAEILIKQQNGLGKKSLHGMSIKINKPQTRVSQNWSCVGNIGVV